MAEITAEGAITFAHQNMLGSTVFQSDASGTVVANYDYDLFGNVSILDNFKTNMLYTGQEYDWENLLHYYNARYYDSETGRFISKDPVAGYSGDLLSRNPYIYVSNNPLMYTDPSGREEDVTNIFYKTMENIAIEYSTLKPNSFALSDWNWLTNKAALSNLKKADLKNIEESFYDELSDNHNIVKKYKTDFTNVGKYNLKALYPNRQWGFLSNQEMSNISKKMNINEKHLFDSEPYGFNGLGDVVVAGLEFRNDIPGNILYGYAGAAAGLSKDFVLKLAGLGNKQEWLGNEYKKIENSNEKYFAKLLNYQKAYNSYPFSWDTYFDDPNDQKAIKIGYDLWIKYPNSSISKKSLYREIYELSCNFITCEN